MTYNDFGQLKKTYIGYLYQGKRDKRSDIGAVCRHLVDKKVRYKDMVNKSCMTN